MRKAIGTDRRRNPQRVLDVLREIDADVVALQEADKRFGGRASAVPHELIDEHGLYKPVQFGLRHRRTLERIPGGLGDKAEKLLKLRDPQHRLARQCLAGEARTSACSTSPRSTCRRFEPRGAVLAELLIGDRPLRVIGMHLDLSGLWRRRQMRAILDAIAARVQQMPTVLMGDTNEWREAAGCLQRPRPRLPGRADRPELPFAPPGRLPRPDHRRTATRDRRRRRALQRGVAARLGPSADLGAAVGVIPAVILAKAAIQLLLPLDLPRSRLRGNDGANSPLIFRSPPALDRRADAHRLAIFGDRAPREVEPARFQQVDQSVVAEDLRLRCRSARRSPP